MIMHAKARFSRDFVLVAIGQIISIFGNQILRYALPLYLLNQTGSSVLFGTILASSFIPTVLLFPIGGILADRVNKRNIMVILDFSTAILILFFYLMVGTIDILPLIAITMIILCGIQGAYQPAVQASVPLLVEAEYIMQGNSIINLINSLASMIGSVIGGILFSIFGLTPILYASIICFFASAVMEMFIHIPFEKKQIEGSMFAIGYYDLKESFHFMIQEQPALLKIAFTFASINLFLTSLVLIGVPVIITQHLGFAPDTANLLYGYAQGVMGAGAILGGVLAGALSKKLKLRWSPFLICGCALSVLMSGVALHLFADQMNVYLILVLGCGILTALATLFQIQFMTSLQIVTPSDLIGKVIACVICIAMCTTPLGQFIYGFVFEHIGSLSFLPFYIASVIMIGLSVCTRHIFSEIDHAIEDHVKS